ncbi:hypothetical protein ACFVKB_47185 [Rhodococcus sp. NPDC127530]|uniref:hypothetical protein n=1 Tax=unclassified Rhodococcus (in: high G+C Gram-positive bacteria) TaxID=192944 RepID=UPI003638FF40
MKNNSTPMKNHATNAATGKNAHTNGTANCRAGRHGTITNPNTQQGRCHLVHTTHHRPCR